MKKEIILITISLLLGGILFLRSFLFGTKIYIISNSSNTLKIPKFSYLKNIDDSNITFNSFISASSLKKELNQIIKKSEKIICNNKEFYYNKNSYITIMNYQVNSKGLF